MTRADSYASRTHCERIHCPGREPDVTPGLGVYPDRAALDEVVDALVGGYLSHLVLDDGVTELEALRALNRAVVNVRGAA